MAENPKIEEEHFISELTEALKALHSLIEDDGGQIDLEPLGIPAEPFHEFINHLVSSDALLRLAKGRLPFPLPEDEVELCAKVFLMGMFYARRELTTHEEN